MIIRTRNSIRRFAAIPCILMMALCGISRAQSPLTQRAASAAEGDAKSSLQPRRPISILGGTSSAELFSEDVGTVLGISAIGKSLYDADDQKRTWSNYCGSARKFAERGEFREAVRAATKALYLGHSGAGTAAMAYGARDLAITYQFAGDWDKTRLWAETALEYAAQAAAQYSNNSYDREIRFEMMKALGDVALREGRSDEAIRRFNEAQSKLPWIGSSNEKERVGLAIANAHRAAGSFEKSVVAFTELAKLSDATAALAYRGLAEIAIAKSD